MNRNRKNVVRLSESKLREMIKEAVVSVTESLDDEDSSYENLRRVLSDVFEKLYNVLKTVNLSNNAFHRIGDKWGEFEDYIYYEMNRRQ